MKMLLLFCIAGIILSSKIDDYRVIKLDHFDTEDSYLPIRPGSKFIIEAEIHNDHQNYWYLENPDSLKAEHILFVEDLDEFNSSKNIYKNPQKTSEEDGLHAIHHFKFTSNEQRSGMIKLVFVYKNKRTQEILDRRIVNVSVIKQDL